jgi:hypothetical protein
MACDIVDDLLQDTEALMELAVVPGIVKAGEAAIDSILIVPG